MKKFTVNRWLKVFFALVGIYELLLVKSFMAGFVVFGLMFLPFILGAPAPAATPLLPVLIYLWLPLHFLIFSILTPLSFAINWYVVFSKKTEHPRWFLWIMPLPFLGLLIPPLLFHVAYFKLLLPLW